MARSIGGFHLERCVVDAEIVFERVGKVVEEGIAGMAAGHDEVRGQRGQIVCVMVHVMAIGDLG